MTHCGGSKEKEMSIFYHGLIDSKRLGIWKNRSVFFVEEVQIKTNQMEKCTLYQGIDKVYQGMQDVLYV